MNIWNCMNAKQGLMLNQGVHAQRKAAGEKRRGEWNSRPSDLLTPGRPLRRKLREITKAPRSSTVALAHVMGGLGVCAPPRGRRRNGGGKSTVRPSVCY